MSGKYVASNIDRERYEVYEILLRGPEWNLCDPDKETAAPIAPIDKTDFSCMLNGEKIRFDLAFIMIHGTPGENGLLQGYFEMMGIPFSTCSSYVSALTFNKYSCKTFLRDTGIRMPHDIFLRKGDDFSVERIIHTLGLPLFVKPTTGGSSFGVTKVGEASELADAIDAAFGEGDAILIEECIKGREMTEGIFTAKGKVIKLPVTEIVPHNDFFDYEAKYQGKSDEICPARISDELAERISDTTGLIYHYFGCRGLVRADYIVSGEEIYFLELNTVPGMTQMSLVPQQVRAAGIDMKEFFNALLDEIA